MKYECEIIQDLIPLVKDGVANEKSGEAVAIHIEECTICKEIYQADTQMYIPPLEESESMELSKVTDYKARIKKRRRVIASLAVAFSVFLVIGTVFITGQSIKLFTGDEYSTSSIADYGNYSGHIEVEKEGFFTLLEIFPKEIPGSAKVEDYYYYCNNGMIDNSYQLYLSCLYNDSDFTLEKERLESLELAFKDEIHKPILTDEGFNYPAVVTIFDDQDSFEYALIDDEKKAITYVFAQSMGIDKSVVPSEHQPKGFKPPKESLNGLGIFNIYRFKLDEMPAETYVIPGIDYVG